MHFFCTHYLMHLIKCAFESIILDSRACLQSRIFLCDSDTDIKCWDGREYQDSHRRCSRGMNHICRRRSRLATPLRSLLYWFIECEKTRVFLCCIYKWDNSMLWNWIWEQPISADVYAYVHIFHTNRTPTILLNMRAHAFYLKNAYNLNRRDRLNVLWPKCQNYTASALHLIFPIHAKYANVHAYRVSKGYSIMRQLQLVGNTYEHRSDGEWPGHCMACYNRTETRNRFAWLRGVYPRTESLADKSLTGPTNGDRAILVHSDQVQPGAATWTPLIAIAFRLVALNGNTRVYEHRSDSKSSEEHIIVDSIDCMYFRCEYSITLARKQFCGVAVAQWPLSCQPYSYASKFTDPTMHDHPHVRINPTAHRIH